MTGGGACLRGRFAAEQHHARESLAAVAASDEAEEA